jgi:hypothetical protein
MGFRSRKYKVDIKPVENQEIDFPPWEGLREVQSANVLN